MKKTFYCVNAEFYDNGKRLACVTISNNEVRSQHRKVPGMEAFKLCFALEDSAREFADFINNGKMGINAALWLFHQYDGVQVA